MRSSHFPGWFGTVINKEIVLVLLSPFFFAMKHYYILAHFTYKRSMAALDNCTVHTVVLNYSININFELKGTGKRTFKFGFGLIVVSVDELPFKGTLAL